MEIALVEITLTSIAAKPRNYIKIIIINEQHTSGDQYNGRKEKKRKTKKNKY